MKLCPTCRSTYTDDSLRFCLQDGSQLVHAGEAESTPDAEVTLRDHLPGWQAGGQATPPEAPVSRHAMPTLRISTPPTAVVHPQTTTGAQREGRRVPSSSNSAMKAALIAVTALLAASIVLGVILWRRPALPRSDVPPAETGGSTSVVTITATASSTRAPFAGNTYEPGNVLDGRLMTAWAEGASGAGIGEWIRCDFGHDVTLNRISIAPGYFKSPQIWARNNRLAAATISFSDGTSRPLRFPDRMEEQILEVGAVKTSWVRIVIDEVYAGGDPDTSISQLAFEFAR
jgi:hypothetical protein